MWHIPGMGQDSLGACLHNQVTLVSTCLIIPVPLCLSLMCWGHSPTYMKGPNSMSKSRQTQQHYQKANQNQFSLTNLGCTVMPAVQSEKISVVPPIVAAVVQTETPSAPIIGVAMELDAGPGPSVVHFMNHTQSASVLSDPSIAGDSNSEGEANLGDVPEEEEMAELDGGHDFNEECESDLDKTVQGPKQAVCNWSEIQKDIRVHLKRNQKTLTLWEINQYLIISNFATLCLKGQKCTEASLEIACQ